MDDPATRTISAPRPPELPQPHRIPVIATAAPLIVSAVLFVVTRSAFTLVFAALGPVVAVASSLDANLSRRRTRKREATRFEKEVADVSRAIEAAHAAEVARRVASTPSVATLLDDPESIAGRWRAVTSEEITVTLGVAVLRSELVYRDSGATASGSEPDPTVEATLAELRRRASRLDRAPVTVRTRTGIGIFGPVVHASAVARGLALQLAATLSPESWTTDTSAAPRTVLFSCGSRSISVVAACDDADLPRELDVRLELRPDGSTIVDGVTTYPEFVTEEQAAELTAVMDALANGLGLTGPADKALPARLDFGSLEPIGATGSTLASVVGESISGPLALDLVVEGPHAVVGGTTGSGKSEFLVSWVLGMAAHRSPSAVTFLFVDFKGGASFGALTDLPHSVGVLTDLDTEQSLRALASLAAELRYRERELAASGLRSIDESAELPFPRLVVVVDEYAALVETLPVLHSAFADIAARGRSLGVHLVLCTQRPAGVVRDGILANCALRVSLRVTSAAESVAVLGTDAAASLTSRPLGRALVSAMGEPAVLFQVARSSPADVSRVIERWAGTPPPRAPWLPPLPNRLELSALDVGEVSDDIPFALADLPSEQAQRVARYRPRENGALLVIGAAGSGKSGVLAVFATAPTTLEVVSVPRDVARMWDALTTALAGHRTVERVLLIDDVDALIAGCAESHRDALVDLIARLLREGPALGSFCVLTAQRPGGAVHGLASLCASRLVLRMPDRAEHTLAGAQGEYVATLPPGGGHWRGDRIQVAVTAGIPADHAELRALTVDPVTDLTAIVSSRPEAMAALLRELAPGCRVVVLAPAAFGVRSDGPDDPTPEPPAIQVADADTWQSHWALFAALQRSGCILFDGCSIAEFRALTRSRELPPPFPPGERTLWIRLPDGEISRARLKRT